MSTFWTFVLLFGICIFIFLAIWKKISTGLFIALSGVWMLAIVVQGIGLETITEVSSDVFSIKREVKAAESIRNDIETVAKELRTFAEKFVEVEILRSRPLLPLGIGATSREGKERRSEGIEEIAAFAKPDPSERSQWLKELENLRSKETAR